MNISIEYSGYYWMDIFWMDIPDFVLNWILNWIIFTSNSMEKWTFKTNRPGLHHHQKGEKGDELSHLSKSKPPTYHHKGEKLSHLSTSKLSRYNQEGDELFQRSSAGSFSRSESRLSMSTPERWGHGLHMLCISNSNLNKAQRALSTPEKWFMTHVMYFKSKTWV